MLESRIGEVFTAIVTGNTPEGVWVRTLSPPAEGKLVGSVVKPAVGVQIRVTLVSANVERGFIDFVLAD